MQTDLFNFFACLLKKAVVPIDKAPAMSTEVLKYSWAKGTDTLKCERKGQKIVLDLEFQHTLSLICFPHRI